VGATRVTYVRVTEAGLKLLRVFAAGDTRIRVSVAGDMNNDGRVDGADTGLAVGESERQLVQANYGFAANLAPVQAGESTLKTHVDLDKAMALDGVARDVEGDRVFWRVVGAEHGAARLSADGRRVVFTPEAGFAGQAKVWLQADDGFAAGAPMELTVTVSDAKLLFIHIERLSVLRPGETAQLRVTGDFEDEQGVELRGVCAVQR